MRINLGCIPVMLMVFSAAAFGQSSIAPLSVPKDFSILIAGKNQSVSLGDDIKVFIEKIGKANNEIVTEREGHYQKYTWPGLEAYCIGTNVVSVRFRTPDFTTARGLKPGDNLSELIRLYGKPQKLKSNYYYLSLIRDSTWELAIVTSNRGTLTEIRLNVGD